MYRRTVGVCVAAGIVALALAGAKLWAQSGGSIQACVASNGNVRIVAVGGRLSEAPMTWSIQGPQGPTGPTGQTGKV